MLGNGVYFADTFAKSLNYATDYYGSHQSSYRLLMLCEVALGSNTKVFEHNYYNQSETNDLHSMKGEGSNIPDPDIAVYDANGVCIPMGPCISSTVPTTGTNTGVFNALNNGFNNRPLLNHNEYAVYDENRVKIRYLMIVRESSSCFLCSSPQRQHSALKPLHEHDVKKYKYEAFNNFEGEVIKAYLSHESKSPQDIFNQGLDDFIESKKYSKLKRETLVSAFFSNYFSSFTEQKWNTPLDLCKESKVCPNCAKDVTAILLENEMASSEIDIPGKIIENIHIIIAF
jgi:hypothetical protein